MGKIIIDERTETSIDGLSVPSVDFITVRKQCDDRDSYLRERDALTAIGRHPDIVKLLGSDDKKQELLLSLAPGESLMKRFEYGDPFSTEEAAQIVTSLAKTLRDLHARGITHWDLSPGNVILDEGKPTLIDFGLSFLETNIPDEFRSGDSGTPMYRSPEHVNGIPEKGAAADMFCLGVLWSQMLSSSMSAPFDPCLGNLDRQILTFEPLEPKRADDTTKRLLRALMNKDPDKRPTAQLLSSLLES